MSSARVVLSPADVAEARRFAEETYEQFQGQSGQYGSTPEKHLLGKLAEIAVDKWLRERGVSPDATFREARRYKEPDLVVGGHGIEVKSWRPHTWEEWGRCVTPNQAKSMRRKSAAVVWVIVDEDADPVVADLVGWSTPDDILDTDVRPTGPAYRPIVNHQIAIDEMRELETLPPVLAAES